MLSILFIDDDPSSISHIKDSLEERGHDCGVKDFSITKGFIVDIKPDVAIVDISDGSEYPGLEICNVIWNSRFCPIVICSAFIEEIEEKIIYNPFVRAIKKGKED